MRLARGKQAVEVHVQAHGQRNEAQDGGRGRQNHRVEAGAAGFHQGLAQGHALGPQNVGEFDEQDAVLYHDAGQGQDAHARHHDGNRHAGEGVAEQHADDREDDFGQDDERLGQGVELGDENHENQADGQHQGHAEEVGGFFLVFGGAAHLHGVALGHGEAGEGLGNLGHHVGAGVALAGEDVGADGDDFLEVFALDGAVGGAVLQVRDCGNRYLAQRAAVGAEADGRVHEGVHVLAVLVGVAHLDVVVVVGGFELAALAAEDGRAGQQAHLGRADALAVGPLTVHAHGDFGVGVLQVGAQALHAGDLQRIDVAVHPLAEPGQLLVVIAGYFDGNFLLLGRAAAFLVHRYFGAGNAFYYFADFGHVGAGFRAGALAQFFEGHGHFAEVRLGGAGLLLRVVGADGDVGDNRFHVRIIVADDAVHPLFEQRGHAVSHFHGRAHRHLHVGVDELGVALGEEFHLGLADGHGHPRKHEQGQHPRHDAALAPARAVHRPVHEPGVAVLESGQRALLEVGNGPVQHVAVQENKEDQEQHQIAHERRARHVADDGNDHQSPHPAQKLAGERRALGVGAVVVFALHEGDGKHRVDDEGHDERREQGHNQRNRQVVHELADDARPKGQRHERRHRRQRAGQHRDEHLAGRELGRLLGGELGLVVVDAVGVFNHHNGVVDHNAQRQQEAEEHNHVQREAQNGQHQKGQEHAQRHAQAHKQGVGGAHEEHQNQRHQNKADDDGVNQVGERDAGVVRGVAGDGDFEVLGQGGALVQLDDCADFVRSVNQVGAAALHHVQRDGRLAVEAGVALAVLEAVGDGGHVADADGVVVGVGDEDVADILGLGVLPGHAHGPALPAHRHGAARDVEVFALNGPLQIVEVQPGGLHLVQVHVHVHLLLQRPDDVHPRDFGQALNLVLNVVGVLLELHQGQVAAQVHVHNRKLREAHLLHAGRRGQVAGQVGAGLVHGVLHQLLGVLHLDAGVEFHINDGVVLVGSGVDFLHPVHRLQLLFDDARHQVFHVGRRNAGVNGAHDDARHHDVGKLLLLQLHVGEEPGDGDEHRDDVDARPVVDGPRSGLEFFL